MIWGVMLDAMGSLDVTVQGFSVNRYSVYFTMLLLLTVLVGKLTAHLHEGSPSFALRRQG